MRPGNTCSSTIRWCLMYPSDHRSRDYLDRIADMVAANDLVDRRKAACHDISNWLESPPTAGSPGGGGGLRIRKEWLATRTNICASCTQRQACAQLALAEPHPYGVYAGVLFAASHDSHPERLAGKRLTLTAIAEGRAA
jgi:hypothetical protein